MTRKLQFWLATCVACLVCSATAEAGTVTLAWNANTETDLRGYVVSYGTASRAYTTTVDVGLNTTTVITINDTRTYYFAVQAYNAGGVRSSYSSEVSGQAVTTLPATADRIATGLWNLPSNGGWFTVRNSMDTGAAPTYWGRLPWPAYDSAGGGVRVASGDIDGDGLAEIVVGLGSGGSGYMAVFDDGAHGYALLKWIQVQWPQYNNANGEVWPAVGDLDGDGRAEIVAGLGAGGQGYIEIFDDAAGNYASLGWRQVAWPAYAAGANGATHPAIGNVDGTGASEIVVGLGNGGDGWVEVFTGSTGNYSHKAWMRVAWPAYTTANGTTFPAAGDVDGDGRAEIVVGLGVGGGGWLVVFDDANANYTTLRWLRSSWPAYNNTLTAGETHPAVGNVDGDSAAEIVIGFGQFAGQGGWIEIIDDGVKGYGSIGWKNADWAAFTSAGGQIFPAVGTFR